MAQRYLQLGLWLGLQYLVDFVNIVLEGQVEGPPTQETVEWKSWSPFMPWPKWGRAQRRGLHPEDRGMGEHYARGSVESPKKLMVGSDKISSAFMRGLRGSLRRMQVTSQSLYPMRECIGMNRRHPAHVVTTIDGRGTSELSDRNGISIGSRI